jgi:hypothetical protein
VTLRFRGGWDNTDAANSPNWVIDNVSITGVVAEPSSLAFLGVAGLGLLRRHFLALFNVQDQAVAASNGL